MVFSLLKKLLPDIHNTIQYLQSGPQHDKLMLQALAMQNDHTQEQQGLDQFDLFEVLPDLSPEYSRKELIQVVRSFSVGVVSILPIRMYFVLLFLSS